MSIVDLAHLLSEMVIVEKSTQDEYKEAEGGLSTGCALATVTIYTRSFCQDAQAITASVCLNCAQIYVDALPSWCMCGEGFRPHCFAGVVLSEPLMPVPTNVQTQPLITDDATVDLLKTNKVDGAEKGALIPVAPTDMAMVKDNSSCDATSPYASMRNVTAPPPPSRALLRDQDDEGDDTQLTSAGLIIMLSLILIGFIVFLRVILAA